MRVVNEVPIGPQALVNGLATCSRVKSWGGPEWESGSKRHDGELVRHRRTTGSHMDPIRSQIDARLLTRRTPTERLRDECLNGEIFYSFKEAQIVMEQWKQIYNKIKPHSSSGRKTPAEFSALCSDLGRNTEHNRGLTPHNQPEKLQSSGPVNFIRLGCSSLLYWWRLSM